MLVYHKLTCIGTVGEELSEISLMTDLSVNKDELVNAHKQFISETWDEIIQFEDILGGQDYERREIFTKEIFEKVTNLNNEEIELLDKVLYNEEIHSKLCPVCLIEHTDGEFLVSLRCPCKRERLYQSCAFKIMKEKSQCPCCRGFV